MIISTYLLKIFALLLLKKIRNIEIKLFDKKIKAYIIQKAIIICNKIKQINMESEF